MNVRKASQFDPWGFTLVGTFVYATSLLVMVGFGTGLLPQPYRLIALLAATLGIGIIAFGGFGILKNYE